MNKKLIIGQSRTGGKLSVLKIADECMKERIKYLESEITKLHIEFDPKAITKLTNEMDDIIKARSLLFTLE